MKLREYQEKIVHNIRKFFSEGTKKLIMQAATGAGKTVMFSYMVKNASDKAKRCLILTDRLELLTQAGGTFEDFGIKYDYFTRYTKAIPDSLVIVGMIETLKRRAVSRLDVQMMLQRIDLLIIDEAHRTNFDKLFPYISKDCYVIGATATPYREGKQPSLDLFYQDIVNGPSISELIQIGFLSKPKYIGMPFDFSGVKMKAGDYDTAQQEQLLGDNVHLECLKGYIDKYARNKKTLIFCPGVQSSKDVAEFLNCFHVDGSMKKEDRTEILNMYASIDGGIMTNCGVLTTGYDCKTIEVIVLYRKTTSLPLYLQMVGRGSRVTETKKEFTIIDFGGNVGNHGFWHSDREWSLKKKAKKKKDKEDLMPVKTCPECECLIAVSCKTCPECGYKYPISEQEKIFVELQELSYNDLMNKAKEASIAELEQMRIAKGYKIGWLLRQLSTADQFIEYQNFKGYKKGWANFQLKTYLQ